MKQENTKREVFNPDNVSVMGSLGLLALGDIGFEAWRKVKSNNNLNRIDEQE